MRSSSSGEVVAVVLITPPVYTSPSPAARKTENRVSAGWLVGLHRGRASKGCQGNFMFSRVFSRCRETAPVGVSFREKASGSQAFAEKSLSVFSHAIGSGSKPHGTANIHPVPPHRRGKRPLQIRFSRSTHAPRPIPTPRPGRPRFRKSTPIGTGQEPKMKEPSKSRTPKAFWGLKRGGVRGIFRGHGDLT